MTKDLIRFENEDFPISYKPAEVNFQGYEALDAKVDALTKDWDKYVVTAESYSYDKKTRAELNRIRRALSDRRKVIVKDSSQQITEFNAKVKGLDLKIKGVVDHLSEGLKTFDEQARKDKHQQNLIRLGELAKEYGVALQELDYQDKWDNKTTSWTTIEEEARQQFDAIVGRIKARKEAEQVIANKANEYTKPAMSANPYLQMLDYKSLPDVLTQMDNDHDYLIKQAKQQEENRKKAIEALEQHGDKYVDAKTGEVVDKVHSVTLKLTGTKEQLTALSNFIRDWGISYERVD
ncbi:MULTISPECIES: DUF1351 domain-containing protein [Lactobacillus]|uniref:Replication protein n=2 Tax=Lactobacillus TaxID=1578 RepID=A0AB33CG56_LACGS|nr:MULTISPECIES: DUF1351 domain-containing protein [Lactobacillus]ART99124.1 replication protein [Lactobacillus gasseri]EJN54675.1 Putative replication protein (Orf309) [Lactobacillus gasseri CECT 5714]MBV6739524.1 DUF1351 domain-containing protein [Lactobacillus gasseri CECT 5714]MDK6868436.1 DUF1351 domain-containing protein [Lactobacillus paragasseri]QTP20656.1 DUF1351 domain-containing protein [Lactobacillus gasseri]